VLRLEVLDWAGPTRWRWRLTEAGGGAFVADHEVELDAGEWQFEAFTDLHRYLRWNAAPDRRLASEAELAAQVGEWIGYRVLGRVGAALAKRRGPVHMEVPPEAEVLAYRPWELARVAGRPLAGHRVSFVIDLLPRRPVGKKQVGERLRMLAVFSLPEGAGALNLRKERHALARLVHEIAAVNNKGVELRVLQYGATRQRLEEALLEAPGWDVVHLSGHGLPAGLLLEDDTGRHDLITSTDLVDLLDLAADQIKLVTLSACESAAVTAAEHLRLLDLRPPTRADPAPTGQLPAVAAEVVRRLDCAVLAMRYPVVDDFAIALAGLFYTLLLGKGQPVAQALALSLPKAAPNPPTWSAPALSAATPALFGTHAADLRLVPPPGGPVVFEAERQKLAGFPPQPDRFVGRVGPMTRAAAALAPRSGRAGVVFYGMAGAGKTACALELAHTHQDSFPTMAWHAAPPEGHDITTALTDFALALERQLPGLKLVHLVNDTAALRDALPGLTEVLEQNRVLIVLDNVESLLTGDSAWRDDRWGLLVDAITAHRGLSRLVLTSRRRPARLAESVLVEPVHALSLAEEVLLAREWPHLSALIDGTFPGLAAETARGLAARTLAVVQGHPKLIELADGHAVRPDTLTVRLDEADATWLTRGTRLDTFLTSGEPAATDADYLSVLDGWTRATAAALPPDTATLFGFLCCLEEDDRIQPVVEGNWADLWQRLGQPGDPPDPDTLLAPLLAQALVAVDTDPDTGRPARCRIHPGIAETGRASAGADFAAAVDTQTGTYWLANLRHARDNEHEQLGWLVLRAARSACPYLLRQHAWNKLRWAAQQVLNRDPTPGAAAALLPLLASAAETTTDADAELRLGLSRTHARALARLHPDQGETLLRQLLDTATAQHNHPMASVLASDLIDLYRGSGRLDEALALADTKADYTRQAGQGPWTQLANQCQRLQILHLQGHYQQVLDEVDQHRAAMAALPNPPDPNDSAITPWNARETILNIGVHAARDLREWQRALHLNAETLESKRRRGAADVDQARTAFNNYFPLLRLGRAAEARDLLRRCRSIFEAANDIPTLGKTLSALAGTEAELGHLDRAIDLGKDALRFTYLAADPDAIMTGHRNLANHLDQDGADRRQVWAHRLAAAVIAYQTGSGQLTPAVRDLTGLLAAHGPSAAPRSFAGVREIVDDIPGVDLAGLLNRLPRRAPDPQAALDHVLDLAAQAAADEQAGHVAAFAAAVAAAANGDARGHPADPRRPRRRPDTAPLAAALSRVLAGDRDPALANGLHPAYASLITAVLDHLAAPQPGE
jgi:tetratricopeptide (TPR) repeat protein